MKPGIIIYSNNPVTAVMKILQVMTIVFITSFTAIADEDLPDNTDHKKQFQECVAVSLYTMQGRELSSIIKNNGKIKQTTEIPEGWSVIGVTTKSEAGLIVPYMVICH